jgi:hypothetical protein
MSCQQEEAAKKNNNDVGGAHTSSGRSPDDTKIICCICLDNIQNILHFCTKYQCSHYFHDTCIRKWQIIGRNKCPYCQQVDNSLICLKIPLCLKIPRTFRDKNEYIYIDGMNNIYINQKAKLSELAKRSTLFYAIPPHRIILEYFNPIKGGKELTIGKRIHKNYMNTLSPTLINYNDLSIEQCNIKDGTFVFINSIYPG